MDRRNSHHLHHIYGSVSHTALTSVSTNPTPTPNTSTTTPTPRGGATTTPTLPPSGQGGGWVGGLSSVHSGQPLSNGAGHLLEDEKGRWRRKGGIFDRGQSWRECSWTRAVSAVWRNVRWVRWALRNSLRNLVNMDRQKSTSLGALVLQTSVLALTIRYSRTETVTGPRYLTSTAVVMSELLKLFICLYMALYSSTSRGRQGVGGGGGRVVEVWREDLLNVREALKTTVPAGLYTLQNNLQFVAVSHLDAATFQVTYQLKILTTAVFSVVFLHRHLDSLRWSALIMLTAGVAMVQWPDSSPHETTSGGGGTTVVGLMAVLVMCLSSGFAGVYFEKILKSSTQSIWAKNVQMAFVSVLLGLGGVILTDGAKVSEYGFFQGYNTLTVIIVIQQAVLGLIISMVMKYADNILKGFASAISIVLTSFISCILLQDLYLSCSFLTGTSIVLISALLYNVDRGADKYSMDIV